MNTVPLLKSRRFWTLIVDFIFSMTTLLISFYVGPQYSDLIKFAIGAIQTIAFALIAAFTVDDAIKAYLAHVTELYQRGFRK
jgi:hypothetical protein